MITFFVYFSYDLGWKMKQVLPSFCSFQFNFHKIMYFVSWINDPEQEIMFVWMFRKVLSRILPKYFYLKATAISVT